MDPLSVYKELVLVFSFWQVQDCYKIIVALKKKEKKHCETSDFQFVLEVTAAFHRGLRDSVVSTMLTSYLEVSLCSNY